MTDAPVSSVEPSENELIVAYYLMVSIIAPGPHSIENFSGLPIITGASKKEILNIYGQALRVVRTPENARTIAAEDFET